MRGVTCRKHLTTYSFDETERWIVGAKPTVRRCAAFFLVMGLAASGCGAIEGGRTGGRTGDGKGELIVLLDATASGDGMQDSQRRHLVDVVVPLAERQHADVVLATIDAAALEAPEIVGRVSFDTSGAGGNQYAAARTVAKARRDLLADADRVFAQGGTAPSSDVAGALAWAAGTLAEAGDGWHGVALLSDAVSTTPPCNMTLAPPSDAGPVVAACFPDGVPRLHGAVVLFLGAGAYRTGDRQPVDPGALEKFWRAVVRRGGGTVDAYGPTVLGDGPSSEEGNDHA